MINWKKKHAPPQVPWKITQKNMHRLQILCRRTGKLHKKKRLLRRSLSCVPTPNSFPTMLPKNLGPPFGRRSPNSFPTIYDLQKLHLHNKNKLHRPKFLGKLHKKTMLHSYPTMQSEGSVPILSYDLRFTMLPKNLGGAYPTIYDL